MPVIPSLALSHGQTLWVLRHAFPTLPGAAGLTLDSYLKYLRREGVPFAPEELGVGTGQTVTYRFEHLMELAVALSLRTQGILPQDVAHLLSRLRSELYPIYRRAFSERKTGQGAPKRIRIEGEGKEYLASGIWLDLRLLYLESGVLSTGGPKALGPAAAIKEFVMHGRERYLRPMIMLSDIAAAVVDLAEDPPEIRRGRS